MGHKEVIEKVIEVEKIIEKIVEIEIPITDDSKIQEFLTEIQKLKDQYKNLEDITRQKEGPLKKLMRGDFLRGSDMKKNLYD